MTTWGNSYKVQIWNGVDNHGRADWYDLNRYDDKINADNRARKQSALNPEDLYLVHHRYWDDVWEEYFQAGKSLGVRQFVRRNDEKERRWIGIPVPTYPATQTFVIERLNEDDLTWKLEDRDIYRLPVLMSIYTKKSYGSSYMRRVTLEDKSMVYFFYGKEMSQEEFEAGLKARQYRLDIKRAYILPETAPSLRHVEFSNRTFETDNILNVVSNIDMLVSMFDDVSARTGHKDIAYIANQLHVALENIYNEVVNRNDEGSPTGD